MRALRKLAQVISPVVDGDDVRIIAVGIVVIMVIGLLLVIMGGVLGLAYAVFSLASGVF